METKYKVGDAVYLKQDILFLEEYAKPKRSIIIEVDIVTCSGGTQVFYVMRRYNRDGSTLVKYNEVEVTDNLEYEKEI
jgi:hypothetical protein